ncbi:hypothetical protein ACQPX6_11150 [Actinomycetospora sp. CA-101289]|uniref:hypothetical protein n=1 Tax=Actinomycetospora sp. CA-101289 TaxID=3239893 RepID=UPI003D99611A
MAHHDRTGASPDAALHRALGVLLTPLVVGAGLLAAHGGAGRVCRFAVLLAVLVGAGIVVGAGVRRPVARPRRSRPQSRRSTATTLPSTVASSPGMGS